MRKMILLLVLLTSSICYADTAPQKLTVMLNQAIGTDHAPLIIAQQQGFFKEEDLEVTFLEPRTTTNVNQHIAQGQAEIGVTYEPQLIEEIDKGLPLIRIGTLIDKPLNCLVVLDKNGKSALSGLNDKAIGSDHDQLAGVMLKSMLANQGVTHGSVKLLNTQDDVTQALLTEKIRAATGVNRSLTIPMLEQKGLKFTTYFPEEHGVPTYSELVFVARNSLTKDPRIPRFLAAIKKAVAYLDEHPKDAWKQFAKEHPAQNTAMNKKAWFNTMPYFAEDPADFDIKEWEQFAKYLQKNKLISKAEPASHYAVIIR